MPGRGGGYIPYEASLATRCRALLSGGSVSGVLSRDETGEDLFAGPLAGDCRPAWYVLVMHAGPQRQEWMAELTLSRAGETPQVVQLLLPTRGGPFGIKLGVLYVLYRPDRATVRFYGTRDLSDTVRLSLRPVGPAMAALGVLLQNPGKFLSTMRSTSGSLLARLRWSLAESAINGQRLPDNYGSWVLFFDRWSDRRRAHATAALTGRPAVQVVVFDAGASAAALDATLASIREQDYLAIQVDVVRPGRHWPASAAPFTAVLQAGEVLAPSAILLLLLAVSGPDAVEAAYADEDRLAPDGSRADPAFKPQPGLTMMCSGLLSRGVWLLRSALLTDVAEWAEWAETLRLQVWFDLYAAGQGGRVRRVPRLLTHRRRDAEAAPPEVLAATVNAGLRRLGIAATAEASFPVRLRWETDGTRVVSVVVPSRLRGEVQVSCLLDVVERTAYPHMSLLVVVTQDAPLDAGQTEAARRLEASGRARVAVLRRGRFNYSLVCNHGAALTQSELICLLNDDVSVIGPDWLGRMVSMFSDPMTGIVGAKLYYPDGRVQHGGIVMGMGGLADHAHRFLPRGAPGYMGRAVLDQELSAVTGACLLIRRDLYEQVGGLDEGLPTAFNDVDLCLKVRALGHSVIMAASVELVHHETLTFGHHYGYDRERELADVTLMQRRWPDVVAADPYHNPNLSLLPNAEWELAYPPREDPTSLVTGDHQILP